MLEMLYAYEKGIPPCLFRMSDSADLNFIMDFKDARTKIQKEQIEKQEHEANVKMAMDSIRKW